jgi:anhydro-N-acetylmuramic acid kinase
VSTAAPAEHADAANERYIGLMSGTSVDGVDAALCRFTATGDWLGVEAHAYKPFDAGLKAQLQSLQASGPDELHRAALAANGLARAYAAAVSELLATTGLSPQAVTALGAHGQTVRHQPGLHDGTGYTLQLNQPALLAELTGMAVVADMRSRDVAAGGQGAPLVPPFHRVVFGRADATVAVVNIGGISNLTVLAPGEPTRGFDCGPGNTLLDAWCQRHLGQAYDKDGAWSASGRVNADLLASLMSDAYFSAPPPKSTGRDHFNIDWLARALSRCTSTPDAVDVQATLCEATAAVISNDVQVHAPTASELLVCGGGALNTDLMTRLQTRLAGLQVVSSAERGLPPLQVEAAAFAWLARMCHHGQPAGEAAVTGARGARVLGAIYPA